MKRRLFIHQAVVLFMLVLLWSPTAYSVNIEESDDWTIDLDGSVKAYGIGMHSDMPGVVLFASPTIGGMGWSSRSALMGIGEARIKFSGSYKEDRFKWNIMLKTSTLLSSQPNIMDSMGGSSGSYEPARYFPLQYTDGDDPSKTFGNEVDRLMFKYRVGKFDFIVGRQPIGLGVGFIWKPADLLGTFSPIDIDKEYKAGVDALRVNITLGEFTELSLIGVAGGPPCRHVSGPNALNPLAPSIWKTPGGFDCSRSNPSYDDLYSSAIFRLRTTFGKWDVGVLGGYVRGDVVAGLFTTGTVQRIKLRTEWTFTHNLSDDNLGDTYYSSKKQFVRGVVGMNYPFKTKKSLSMILELYYNGYGTTDPAKYMEQAQSARTAIHGEVLNLGQFYGGYGINWALADRAKLSFMVMANLVDPSFHGSLGLEFTLDDNSSLLFGGFLPIGQAPQINTTTMTFDVKSEFGLYPKMVYAQYKRYF
jgi:hypothetical protein